jgi:endonuclease/exonuclease/phosphatase family metal-dependent hydrolase
MSIKAVSVNLWLGGILLEGIVDFLTQQDADIVLLQEVYDGTDSELPEQYRSIEALQKRLTYSYVDFVADFLDFDRTNGKARRGNAIFSKFPITERDAVFFNSPYSETYHDVPGNYHNCPRDLQHVTVSTPEGSLHVFNIQGAWDLDGDNYGPLRKQMSDAIIKAVTGKAHVVLGGDTNARPTNQAIRRLDKYLVNVYGNERQTSFNMRRKENPGYATSVVDMFLVSRDVQVLSHECPDIDISDHLPLIMTINLL